MEDTSGESRSIMNVMGTFSPDLISRNTLINLTHRGEACNGSITVWFITGKPGGDGQCEPVWPSGKALGW